MKLADLQAAFARACVDPQLRRRLREARSSDTPDTARSPGNALARLPGFEDYARSLVHKRRGEVFKILPRTVAALGPAASRFFARWHEQTPPPDRATIRDSARSFSKFIESRAADAWCADCARFERTRIDMAGPARLLVRRYRHDPRLLANLPVPERRPRRSIEILVRIGRRWRSWIL